MPTAYPIADDLEDFLTAHGITLTAAQTTQLSTLISAASAQIESETDQAWVETASQTRYFDPPTNADSILHVGELVTATAVVYAPIGGTSETYTVNEDYWLEPYNAAALGRPYTQVRFDRTWVEPLAGALRRAIRITGTWNLDTIPSDVWQAVLMWAACLAVLMPAASAVPGSGALKRRRIDDIDEEWAASPWAAQIAVWQAEVRRVVQLRGRVEFV